MSAYSEHQTQFGDAELLCSALRALGIKDVQYHATAIHLEGYHGDKRPETAEVVIPRRAVGPMATDIGFKRGPDGTFQAIISEYDSRKYGAEWRKRLRNEYAEQGILAKAKKAGLRPVGKKIVDGKLRLQFVQG